jgi:hypothetical protein
MRRRVPVGLSTSNKRAHPTHLHSLLLPWTLRLSLSPQVRERGGGTFSRYHRPILRHHTKQNEACLLPVSLTLYITHSTLSDDTAGSPNDERMPYDPYKIPVNDNRRSWRHGIRRVPSEATMSLFSDLVPMIPDKQAEEEEKEEDIEI